MSAPRRNAGGERGSAATELVLLAPLVVVLLLFVAFCGRLVLADGQVDAAARDAARAATLARDPGRANADARRAAAAALAGNSTPCDRIDVDVAVGDFQPGGTVAVDLACQLSLGDLGLLGLDAPRTLRGDSTAVIDRYRGVTDS